MPARRSFIEGSIDVYRISTGFAAFVRTLRLKWHGFDVSQEYKRTSDRYLRSWQAEHSGKYDYLGAVRAYTRTGAWIKMHKRIEYHRDFISEEV